MRLALIYAIVLIEGFLLPSNCDTSVTSKNATSTMQSLMTWTVADVLDNVETIIPTIRYLEDRLLQQQFSALDCFDDSKCVLIFHSDVGRSGNRQIQLDIVENILARCSGAAISHAGTISPNRLKDNLVHFAPIQVFGKNTCYPAWDRQPDMERVLQYLTRCQAIEFAWSWSSLLPDMNCSLQSPPVYHKVHLSQRFPAWLEISLDAWTFPMDNSTAVLHFRGGDLFLDSNLTRLSRVAHGRFQPVCDHYIQSFRHSGAACALLVAEDDKNPCVADVVKALSCTRRPPPACDPACAFTLFARASLIINSRSSFTAQAIRSFGGAERRVYNSYCSRCPRREGAITMYCTSTDRKGLVPWIGGAQQLDILKTRPARVVAC